MRLCGILLFLVGALEILRMLCATERKRVKEAEGLYLLLRQIQSDACARSLPLAEIYAAFENEALARAGFLRIIRTEGFLAALEKGTLSLPEKDLHTLFWFARGLGTRFLDEEREACANAAEDMLRLSEKYRAELPRRLKIKRTFLLTGTGMLLLLLV